MFTGHGYSAGVGNTKGLIMLSPLRYGDALFDQELAQRHAEVSRQAAELRAQLDAVNIDELDEEQKEEYRQQEEQWESMNNELQNLTEQLRQQENSNISSGFIIEGNLGGTGYDR